MFHSHSKQDIWAIRNLKQFMTQDEGQVHLSTVLLVECTFFIVLDLMTHEVPPCNNIKSNSTLFSLTSSSEMSPKEKQSMDHSYISEEICVRFEAVSSLVWSHLTRSGTSYSSSHCFKDICVYISYIKRIIQVKMICPHWSIHRSAPAKWCATAKLPPEQKCSFVSSFHFRKSNAVPGFQLSSQTWKLTNEFRNYSADRAFAKAWHFLRKQPK